VQQHLQDLGGMHDHVHVAGPKGLKQTFPRSIDVFAPLSGIPHCLTPARSHRAAATSLAKTGAVSAKAAPAARGVRVEEEQQAARAAHANKTAAPERSGRSPNLPDEGL